MWTRSESSVLLLTAQFRYKKVKLVSLKLQVTRQEAEKLAGAYGMRYVETSARDAINVEHAFTELTREIFARVRSGNITIQEGWEGVKSGFVPNVVHSSEEVTKSDRRCLC